MLGREARRENAGVREKFALHGLWSGSGEEPRPAYGLHGGHRTRKSFLLPGNTERDLNSKGLQTIIESAVDVD